MYFEVLGPVRVVREGRDPGAISELRRRLLAVLLVRANRPVSTDLLCEALWRNKLPDRPGKSLQLHIHRLRQALDDPARLAGASGGYRLEVGPGELDETVFADLHTRARQARDAGDLDSAAGRFRNALALWKGAPYADVDEQLLVAAETRRLAEERVLALEELYDCELARGLGREIVPELGELVSEYPLRERFTAQLMHALYRSGRRTRALTAFRNARKRLAEELGAEPGRELRALEAEIRAEDRDLLPNGTVPTDAPPAVVPPSEPAASPTPVQLPPAPVAFVGREVELAELSQAVDRPGDARLTLIAGMAGVGKTALAVRFAHSVADRFPDGQLYVDLRGHAPGPALEPLAVLGRLLRALGIDRSRLAAVLEAGDTDAATAEFRSLIAGRRILLLLDNAASPEQVRPLLPAASTCCTIVTSRNLLSGLVAHDGARRIALDALPGDEAWRLLSELAGVERLREYGADLASACGGLPLALRIAGARLADEPHLPVQDYLVDLRRDGPTELVLDDDERSAVASAFDLSYRRLDSATRRTFRLLGLVPGPDVTIPAAAALCGTSVTEARKLVRRLTGAHLLEEHAPGRYRFHDLLRAYARQRTEVEDDSDARTVAVQRLLAWYYQGKIAAVMRRSARRREPAAPEVPTDLPACDFADGRTATAWLRAEFDNLAAAVRFAARTGRPHWCWHLAIGSGLAAIDDGRVGESLEMLRNAVAAANEVGDRAASAHTMVELAAVLYMAGLPVPEEHLTEALGHAEASGELAAWGYGLTVAGTIRTRQQRLREAEACFRHALQLHRATGDKGSEGMALNSLAAVAYRFGDLSGAEHYSEQVLELKIPENTSTTTALANLIELRILLGKLDGSDELFARASKTAAAVGEQMAAFKLACKRVELLCIQGRYDEALHHANQGVEDAARMNQPHHHCEANFELGRTRLGVGDLEGARNALECAEQLAIEHGLQDFRGRAVCALAEVHLSKGDMDAALRRGEEAVEMVRRWHPVVKGAALVTVAKVALAFGRESESIDRGETALRISERIGNVPGQAYAHRVLAEAHAVAGRPAACARHTRQAQRLLEPFYASGAADPATCPVS